ncbi:MAG: PQQ-binding-like beta-propeller repeat protein [Acidimicrobiia bacterium]
MALVWITAAVVIGRVVETTRAAPSGSPAATTARTPAGIGGAPPQAAPSPPTAQPTAPPRLATFRGGPERSGPYGFGPVPKAPKVAWRFPDRGSMCSPSEEFGKTNVWCGMGWTGQPSVFERNGRTWVVFGAYDRALHFLDATTGERIIGDFPTGDIIKGSVTVDPEYPIIYSGSRDNFLHVIAIDRPEPVELWKLPADAAGPPKWNNDWDPSPLIVGDRLITGGENSYFHVVKLNRAIGPDGLVTAAPTLEWSTPGWDDELLRAVGDGQVSIENSVAMRGTVAYFANSGGLVQGWDLKPLFDGTGEPTRVFRFWTGDDTDASVVIDQQGALYVGSEYERETPRSRDVGQFMKLDPTKPDPLVWSIKNIGPPQHGTWSTPALHGDLVIEPMRDGRLLGIRQATGEVVWEKKIGPPVMGSPVVVDNVLMQGDCSGHLRAWDLSNPSVDPPLLWDVNIGGCLEATPAVYNGTIFIGTRAGFIAALRD